MNKYATFTLVSRP